MSVPEIGYLLSAFGLMLAVPPALVAALVIGIRRGLGPRFGLFLGVVVAAWASVCWAAVPYCGAYPNIVGGALGTALYGVGVDSLGKEAVVHLTNATLWPWLGWLTFREVRRNMSVGVGKG